MRRSTFVVAVVLLIAGCSSSSIVGRRLDNFTARYNSFYNAERAFRTGIKAVEKPDERIDRTYYLSIFPQAQGGSVPDFGNAVKKSADVLRKHPSSKWVDDALLLIGKSYFYQQNYVGAEQKFREVMTLPTRLDDEARFWLARTLIASGSYDAAAEHLNVSLAGEELSSRWEPLLRLSFAELHVKQGQLEEAAEALAQGLGGVRGNDVRARAQFLMGQVYETLGRYKEAVAAFEQVERFKPPYELSYAAEHLNVSLAGEELSSRWEPLLRLSFAELHVKQGQLGEAAEALAQGLGRVRGNDVRARAQFLMGQVYETLGRYEEAVAAFEQVERFKPPYELSYAAQLSAARVMGLHGNPDEALQLLRRMERDDKHYNNRAEVIFVRGLVLQAAGHPGDAFATYDNILYDNDEYNIQAIRGRIHYAMAELYRDAYEDFITAAAHFDTASTAIGQAGTEPGVAGGDGSEFAFTKEAITDSKEQAEVFSSFASVMGEVAELDSLLWLGSLDDAAFDAAVLDMRKRLAEDMAEEQRTLEQRELEQGFRNAAVTDATRPRDTATLATSAGGASFLFHQEPARVQEGKLLFADRWGDRPLVPNWRRMAAITAVAVPRVSFGEATGVEADSAVIAAADQIDAALPPVDVSAVPRDPASRKNVLESRALSRYELGNVLFLSMNRPDSAAAWYRMVVEEASDVDVARRAYYALAEVQRALGDTLAANEIYRDILDRYPDSDFANLVRERLGMSHVESAASDSLALADAAYARAYATWKAGRYVESVREMMEVAARYSTTSVAPRALFAAASAYTEWAQRSDAELFGSMQVQIPDSVLNVLGIVPQATEGGTVPTPDSIIAPEEVRQSLADSFAVNAPPEAAAQDSLVIPAEGAVVPVSGVIQERRESAPGVSLDAIYAAIAQHYPGSPYADPSQRVLKALDEQRQERAAADSAATALGVQQEGAATSSDSMEAVVDSARAVSAGAPGASEPGEEVETQAGGSTAPAEPGVPVVAPPAARTDSLRIIRPQEGDSVPADSLRIPIK